MSQRSSADMWHLVKCQVKTFISYPAAITHQHSAFSLKRPLRLGPPINSNKPWCWKVVLVWWRISHHYGKSFPSSLLPTVLFRRLQYCAHYAHVWGKDLLLMSKLWGFYDAPIVHEFRNHFNLQNWVIRSTKWIPGKLITLATDMQRRIRQLAEYWEDCVVIALSVMIMRVK